MNVAFINENTLGHTSYLPAFIGEFERRPELGIRPFRIDAVPLPPHLRWGETTVPGLRRWGLDLGFARWRRAASRNVREQFDELRRRTEIEAAVINTQSVGLEFATLAEELPVFVCLDATFDQLVHSPWLSPSRVARAILQPWLAPLRRRERELLLRARRRLAWSEPVRRSLVEKYGFCVDMIDLLPPSLLAPPRRAAQARKTLPNLLFIGADYLRKGGPLVREVFERHFSDCATLHLVTRTAIPAGPQIQVHTKVVPHSEAWRRLWEESDVFIFPSRLETFGIVLIEALAFMSPVLATDAGAARDILDDGSAGWLVNKPDVETVSRNLREILDGGVGVQSRVQRGRHRFESCFDLGINTERLAEWLTLQRPSPKNWQLFRKRNPNERE